MKKRLRWLSEYSFPAACTVYVILYALVLLCFGVSKTYPYIRDFFRMRNISIYQVSGTVAQFADPTFEQVLRQAIDRPNGVLYQEELEDYTRLELIGDPRLTDLTDLAMFSNLEHLSIVYGSIEDVSPIAKLPRLVSLNLTGNHIEDITPLCSLQTLKYLNLSNNRINFLPKQLYRLENLTILILDFNDLRDMADVSQLISLTDFHVRYNKLNTISLSEEMPSLIRLYAHGNPISFVEATTMNHMPVLQELDVGRTDLTNIDFLRNISTLVSLDISGLPLDNFSALSGCTALEALTVYGFKKIDVSVLQALPKFNSIYLDRDYDRSLIDFMIGNFKTGDLYTRIYLCGKKNRLID
jgi:hypothetical protein